MAAKRPNFLIVVADDLGYSDIAPFGGEIQTPTLDRLAKEGVRLTNFHTASACSPTRSMLLSGTDHHIAGLGQLAEHMASHPSYKGRPGYEGYLNTRVAAASELLQDAGYFTTMSGKWHLGMDPAYSPHARGFTKSFSYLPGAGNHYNYEPQATADVPASMRAGKWWMRDGEFIDRTTLPSDFYSTHNFTKELLGFLDGRNAGQKVQPFFAYLAYTAPHWPLQAPQATIAKYRGWYNEGPEVLREKRLARLKELGLVDKDVVSAPMVGALDLDVEWEKKTTEERIVGAKNMEIFAAMVDEVDQGLARIVSYLESSGELDNTFILFMSDNGAEGTLLEAVPTMGNSKSLGAIIESHYDNSLENMGNGTSWTWYGPRWACAAMAPSRGFKTWITEGGIRCPCIVRYPPLFQPSQTQNAVSNAFTTVMDILPTMLELAGVPEPQGTFRGREVVSMRGASWVPHLTNVGKGENSAESSVHEAAHITGWELFGLRAIRMGDWKALWMPPPRGSGEWELYDLSTDVGELQDQAKDEPEILAKLMDHWETYFAETGMFEYENDFPYVQQ